jgi:alkylation response protein AidB-like acyl-CoA dehydrogenase
MYIGYSEEQEALRKEIRAYYEKLLTPEVRAALAQGARRRPDPRKVVRQMGADGWLGIGWPTQYGGQGRSEIEQFIFFDESMRSGAPVPMLTTNTVGPTIARHGSEEQKAFFLPKILAGEIHFCIGYSEPGAGTDLAALTTRADLDGDEYVINGQKLWTSLASDSDYCWLAVRTDPERVQARGPLDHHRRHEEHEGHPDRSAPPDGRARHQRGVLRRRARAREEHRAGPEQGLEADHRSAQPRARDAVLVGRARALVRRDARVGEARRAARRPQGDRPGMGADQPRARLRGLEFLRLINWKVAWTATKGSLSPADASATKVFGTEFYLESFRLLMEILGQRGYLKRGSPEAVFEGQLEILYRGLLILTFGGGTNEIQRDLIGLFGLGLPRVPRM